MKVKLNKSQYHKVVKKGLRKRGLSYKKGILIDESGSKTKEVSNFILIPKRLIIDDTGDKHIELIAVIDGIIHDQHIVNSSDIEKKYFLSELYGGLCNIFPSGGVDILVRQSQVTGSF